MEKWRNFWPSGSETWSKSTIKLAENGAKNGDFEIPLEYGREVSEMRTIEGIFDLAAREVVFKKNIFAMKELR